MFKVRSLSFIIFSLLVCSQASAMKKIIPVFKNLNKRAFTQLTKNSSLKKALLVGGGTVGLGIGSKYAYDYIEENQHNINTLSLFTEGLNDFQKFFKWCKEHNKNPNHLTTDDGNTALMLACKMNNLEIMKELIEYGDFNINAKNKEIETVLMMACEGSSPSTWKTQQDIISYLLSLDDIDINAQTKRGSTALLIALDSYLFTKSHFFNTESIDQRYKTVELLLKQSNLNVNLSHKTVYKHQIYDKKGGSRKIKEEVFWNALTKALNANDKEMVSLLLTCNNIDIKSALKAYQKDTRKWPRKEILEMLYKHIEKKS